VLSEEDVLTMPAQVIRRRTEGDFGWHAKSGSVKRIVGTAVVEVVSKSTANLEPEVARDREVTLVEEPMEISSKKQAVGDFMWTFRCVRLNV